MKPIGDKNKEGYVYFIQNGNIIKIGRTKNYKKRFKQFKTTIPLSVVHRILYTRDMYGLEKYYHDRYKQFRVVKEWFVANEVLKDKNYFW